MLQLMLPTAHQAQKREQRDFLYHRSMEKGRALLSDLPVAIGSHNEAAEAQIPDVFMHV